MQWQLVKRIPGNGNNPAQSIWRRPRGKGVRFKGLFAYRITPDKLGRINEPTSLAFDAFNLAEAIALAKYDPANHDD